MLAILSYIGGVAVVGTVEDGRDRNYQVEFGTLSAPHCKLRSLSMGLHKGIEEVVPLQY